MLSGNSARKRIKITKDHLPLLLFAFVFFKYRIEPAVNMPISVIIAATNELYNPNPTFGELSKSRGRSFGKLLPIPIGCEMKSSIQWAENQ